MEKAYLCPKCNAELILDGTSPKVCLFCHTALTDNDELSRPKGGFFAGDMIEEKRKTCTCKQCGKSMYIPSKSPVTCVFCGSQELTGTSLETSALRASEPIAFQFSREEAEKAYLDSVKKEKRKAHGCDAKEYLDALAPVYVPFFFFDYHVFASTILSVVPIVKQARHIGEKVANVLLYSEFTLEKTASNITPYPKTIASEMAWRDVPISASSVISLDKLDQISPIKIGNVGSITAKEAANRPAARKATEEAVLLSCDLASSEVRETFLRRIREFVKQCVITENLGSFSISSYVDDTNYEEPIGQLIYVPLWIMRKRKKDEYFVWYMNGITGEVSEIFKEPVFAKEEIKQDETQTLAAMSKKKIRKMTIDDVGGENQKINFRTYMIDIMASTITRDMKLNEMATDKSLLELERSIRKAKVSINVPVSSAYQPEAEKAVLESKGSPLPSAAVPLPTKHSHLYRMKEEAMEISLGQGQRLPERPVDRRIGNEEEMRRDDTPSAIAVEVGLSDMPEYDPSGPNPFKNS